MEKMSRYFKLETKLKAVRLYRSGKGTSTIGRVLGVTGSQVLRWVNLYNIGGKKALCNRNRMVDAAKKEECVRLVLEKGLSCEQAAIRNQIGRSSLARWVDMARKTGGYEVFKKKPIRRSTMGRPRKKQLDEMTELERLRYENLCLRAEIDLLKKVEALAEARERSGKKTGRTPSKD